MYTGKVWMWLFIKALNIFWKIRYHNNLKIINTSLRREAQQVCLIFQTTAATSSKDKKQLQLQKKKKKSICNIMVWKCLNIRISKVIKIHLSMGKRKTTHKKRGKLNSSRMTGNCQSSMFKVKRGRTSTMLWLTL